MKSRLKLSALVLGLTGLFSGCTSERVAAQGYNNQYDQNYNDQYYQNDDNGDVSLQTFYDELSPYGTWIHDPQYGYVWRPDVDQRDFRPYYSNGRWVMTEYGNTWVSNYDWGWAPFHYGRWVYNRYRQWIWLPDTVWGPAWVSWRSGGGYYGWAPLGPSINVNISFGRRYVMPDYCWNFVPQRQIYYSSFPRYYSNRNVTIIHQTTIINNTYVNRNRTYYTGPRADEIRRATNQNVRVYDISRSNRPGAARVSDNNVNIYQPRPSRATVRNEDARPRNVEQSRGNSDRNNNGVVTRPDRASNGQVNPSRDNNNRTMDNNQGNDQKTSRPWRFDPNGNRNANQNRSGRVENGNPNANGARSDRGNSSNNDAQRQAMEQAQRQNNERMQREQANRAQQQMQAERNNQQAQQQQEQRQRMQREQNDRAQQQEQQRANERSQMQQREQRQRVEAPQQRSSDDRGSRSSGNEGGGRSEGRSERSGRPGRG